MPYYYGGGTTYDVWFDSTITTSSTATVITPCITSSTSATSSANLYFNARLASLHQMAEQGVALAAIEAEWQTIVNSSSWATVRQTKAKPKFNRDRVKRAERRAMERWRMGVRDSNLQHPQQVLQRDAQTRAAEQTAVLREAARKKAAETAAKRAEELLLSQLTPEQLKTYKDNKWFVVEGGLTGIKYRVRHADHMVANVDVLTDDGKQISHRLCAHLPLGTVPTGDQLVAQKLMLEGDEEQFLRIANRHRA